MSVKARNINGVFQPLEEVKDAAPGKVYQVFPEEELSNVTEELAWLKAAERSFDFWHNEEDAVYDSL